MKSIFILNADHSAYFSQAASCRSCCMSRGASGDLDSCTQLRECKHSDSLMKGTSSSAKLLDLYKASFQLRMKISRREQAEPLQRLCMCGERLLAWKHGQSKELTPLKQNLLSSPSSHNREGNDNVIKPYLPLGEESGPTSRPKTLISKL